MTPEPYNKPNKALLMPNAKMDAAVGRVKQAFGALIGSKRLKRDGRIDHAGPPVDTGVNKVAVFSDSSGDGSRE